MHKITPLLMLSVALLGAPGARAQLLNYEGFDYTAGSAVIATEGTGGTGWGTSYWTSKGDSSSQVLSQVLSSGLQYTDGQGNHLATAGGSLFSSGTTTGSAVNSQAQRVFSSTAGTTFGALAAANTVSSQTLWVSYLWQGNTSGATTFRQGVVAFLTGATASAGVGSERLDIGMPNVGGTSTGTPNVSLWSAGSTGAAGSGLANTYSSTAPQLSTVSATGSSATFVLMEFNVDNVTTTADSVKIWLNPILNGSTPTTTADLSYSTQDFSAINGIRILSNGYNATYGSSSQTFDEFRIGDTVTDVTPIVPEPGSVALACLGGLALLGLRRKH